MDFCCLELKRGAERLRGTEEEVFNAEVTENLKNETDLEFG